MYTAIYEFNTLVNELLRSATACLEQLRNNDVTQIANIDELKKTMLPFEKCDESNFILSNWRVLAASQSKFATFAFQNEEQKKFWCEKAIESLKNNIPENEFTPDDWRNLAKYQFCVGKYSKEMDEWQSARDAFFASLDSCLHFSDLKKDDFDIIKDCYQQLSEIYKKRNLESELFNFGYKLIYNQQIATINENFLRIYNSILNLIYTSSNPSKDPLLHALLQLMHLIDLSIYQTDCPPVIKKWLGSENSREQFKKMLNEAEHIQPQKILKIENEHQAPTALIGIAFRLLGSKRRNGGDNNDTSKKICQTTITKYKH